MAWYPLIQSHRWSGIELAGCYICELLKPNPWLLNVSTSPLLPPAGNSCAGFLPQCGIFWCTALRQFLSEYLPQCGWLAIIWNSGIFGLLMHCREVEWSRDNTIRPLALVPRYIIRPPHHLPQCFLPSFPFPGIVRRSFTLLSGNR